MLRLFLCFSMLVSYAQVESKPFYVDKVLIFTKYDPKYIFRRENALLHSGSITQKDISCFIDELKASGLFQSMQIKSVKRTSDIRTLHLTVKYQHNIQRFTISEIRLVGLPEVDEAKFLAKLKDKGIDRGTPLLKYYYGPLEQRVNESLREALPPRLVDQYQGSAWISIRPDGTRKVKLIVSPEYQGCSPK